MMEIVIHDCTTGKTTRREMTPEEIAEDERTAMLLREQEEHRKAEDVKRREAIKRLMADPSMDDIVSAIGLSIDAAVGVGRRDHDSSGPIHQEC